MKNSKHELSWKKKRELETSIIDFKVWLRNTKKLRLDPAENYSSLTFPRPTSADWIIKIFEPIASRLTADEVRRIEGPVE